MYLMTFCYHGVTRIGAKVDNFVLDLKNAYLHFYGINSKKAKIFDDMRSLLESGEEALGMAAQMINKARLGLKKSAITDDGRVFLKPQEIEIEAPLSDPQKVIGIGLNYMDHCRETNIDCPEYPVVFAKFPSAIVGPNDPIVWPPQLTRQVDYEAELAVIIGERAQAVEKEKALRFVAGYTIANDISARDLQLGDGQWVRGKSLDTFCPLGPYLVTKDEIDNPHNLAIQCTINGKIMQKSNTKHLIFDIPFLVSFLSQTSSLYPGDVICTGTPGGIGASRDPQVFLKTGDVVTVEIEKLGKLTNPVG